MDRFSPLALAAIGIILLVFILVNVWMVFLMKKRGPSTRASGPQKGGFDASKLLEVARSPFKKEQQQLDELSKRVEDLKEQPPGL